MLNRQLDHHTHTTTAKKYPLCFLAHDIDSPANIGSFFRIADALGVEKIYLTGNSVTPPNSKLNRISRATHKYVPYHYEESPFSVINRLRDSGYTIVSLELTSSSIDIDMFLPAPDSRICLILGSEKRGVSQALLNASDKTIHIPMHGTNSSMNVASACSIAGYALTRKLSRHHPRG